MLGVLAAAADRRSLAAAALSAVRLAQQLRALSALPHVNLYTKEREATPFPGEPEHASKP